MRVSKGQVLIEQILEQCKIKQGKHYFYFKEIDHIGVNLVIQKKSIDFQVNLNFIVNLSLSKLNLIIEWKMIMNGKILVTCYI